MNLTLKFNNIVDVNGLPKIKISVNGELLENCVVSESIDINMIDSDNIRLKIEHYGKDPNTDTIVENGTIVKDRSFELDSIIVDGYDLEELKWQSQFVTEQGETLDKCLFFGPNGIWTIDFERPILRWILKTRHELNDNDPTWEEDYNSYVSACKLLSN